MRSSVLPGFADSPRAGIDGFRHRDLERFFLPKGTLPEIVKRLSDATSQAMDSPVVESRLREMGVTAVAPERRSPQYLARFVVEEIARWAGPIKQNGLQVD